MRESGTPRENIRDYIIKCGNSDKIFMTDIYRVNGNKSLFLDILVPITGINPVKKLYGILVIRIDPARFLYPIIQSWPTSSMTGESLFNPPGRQGRIIPQ